MGLFTDWSEYAAGAPGYGQRHHVQLLARVWNPPFAGAPVPRHPRAWLITINESVLHKRKNEVLVVIQDRKGQQRKRAIAGISDGFARVHTRGVQGWVEVIDTDVHDWLRWLDTKGAGNTVVHTRLCPGVGSATRDQCPEAEPCPKCNASASHDEAHLSNFVWHIRSN